MGVTIYISQARASTFVTRVNGSAVYVFENLSNNENDHIFLSLGRLFPPNLYKGSLFLGGGGQKLFYVGAQDQYYTYTMFDQSSMWVRNVIMGDIELPGHDAMVADAKSWLEREESSKDCFDEIRFQVWTNFGVQMVQIRKPIRLSISF